ncbi:MAG: hypothetical protein NC817_00590 [Candidatus Omnitrophica bacterium]|nr:hypothetical protein [Candidatus Omnitrophota bacterium]MCM8824349.1 hypothetical protein [Candidatus Omnitrophota bacterium]MCM8827010.1 hypothetical protein [Candidatus Omnitrophota bacterium]
MATIVFSRKREAGKTAITSLIIRSLIEKERTSILAVDEYINVNLYLSLGVRFNQMIPELRYNVC